MWEDATGNVHVESKLIAGDGVFAFSLFATEWATVKELLVLESTVLRGKLTGQGPTSLESELTVLGPTSIESKLNVLGTTTLEGKLLVLGTTTLSGGLTVPSSRRLKYDISGLSGPAALTLLDGLSPVVFKFKADDSADTHLGFIAEDIPAVLAGPNGQSYRPFEIIAVLTKAFQEQQTMIGELQQQVRALNAAAGHAEPQ